MNGVIWVYVDFVSVSILQYYTQIHIHTFLQPNENNKQIPKILLQHQNNNNKHPSPLKTTIIMIIEPEHNHNNQSPEHSQPQSEPQQILLSIFDTMLQISQQNLHQKTHKDIERMKRYEQQKVYLSYCDDPSQYLLHMLHKSQSQNSDQVAEMIMGRQNKVVTAIKNDKYSVKFNNQGEKLKKIKDQLASKIVEMRHNFANLDTPQPNTQEKTEEIYKGFMEFRKKGYWNEESEQAKKARRFLNKMRKQKSKISKQHEKNLQRLEEIIKQQQLKQKKQKEEEQKRIFEQISKRRERINSVRKFKAQQHKKKLMQASSFVDKYKSEKPAHIINQQKFKKEVLQPIQEQNKRKLNEIKKNRKPIDAEELELHEQRYEEFKQKLLEVYERRQQDNELYEKNMQKLKQLYHGHYHEKIEEEMNNYSNAIEQKKKNREKISSYSAGVKQEFRPKIDNKKKSQLQSLIKLLDNKSLEKGKKKVKNQDGSIQFLEISPDEHKKLGISYLQHLRKYNEGKKRKEQSQDRSASMMDLSKKKIVYPDYLQQMRSKSRIETASTKSRHGWRKIISQEGFSNRDKYNSVMDHVSLLEHQARQKQLELKYMKGGSKALELKQKLDKYYLESVAAKMTVLKDVILKQ